MWSYLCHHMKQAMSYHIMEFCVIDMLYVTTTATSLIDTHKLFHVYMYYFLNGCSQELEIPGFLLLYVL